MLFLNKKEVKSELYRWFWIWQNIICFQGNRDERETVDISLAKQDAQVGEKTWFA